MLFNLGVFRKVMKKKEKKRGLVPLLKKKRLVIVGNHEGSIDDTGFDHICYADNVWT